MKPTSLTAIAALLAAAPASAWQAQALVAQYDLDELAGSIAHDGSSNAQDGSFSSGVELGLAGAAATTGRAARFVPGQEGCASIPTAPGLAYLRSNFSVTAWIKPEANGGIMRIFGSQDFGWSCARTDTGLRFSVRYVQDFVKDCDVPLGQWSHVAFVFDGGFDCTMYLNGVSLGTTNGIWPAYAPSAEWNVGTLNGQAEFWNGLLDDIQVYAGALTADEVAFLRANPGTALDLMVGTPFCFGDGHGTPCPCFNYADHDAGCVNSTGEGGRLRSDGSNSAGADDLTFTVDQLPANQPALLFVGDNAANGGKGNVFGDGLRCANGGIRRLGVRAANSAGVAEWSAGLRVRGGWEPGDTQRFQAWYRDPVAGPCATGFNLTQGIQVSFVQ